MDFGAIDPVAIYAAIVSTIALGWQIQKERRARRPQVEVKLSYSLLTYPDRPGAVGVARLEARNRGDMPIRVASAGFDLQDGSGGHIAHTRPQPEATLPGVIEPRDSGFTYLLEDALGPLDPYRPLIGWVLLSTGERIHSKPTTLLRR
jgi:hypothetical protein